MELISDILLIAGALGAAFYCVVLSRRLRRFNDLEKGVGGAIAVLSAQVDDMTKTLQKAQGVARGSNASLEDLTNRAEGVSRKLELLVAALHDLPEPAAQPAGHRSSQDIEEKTEKSGRGTDAVADMAATAPAEVPLEDTESEQVLSEAPAPETPEPEERTTGLFRSNRNWLPEAVE